MTEHIYAHEHPETDRKRGGGFTLWFTGLSASGKTTIAHLVGPAIEERGPIVEYLDGDTVRIAWVASRLTRHGAAVIASAISPYAEVRARARQMVEEFGAFVEVFVDVSVEEATRRDVKGLYEKALKGEIQNFTGVNDPYEKPENPEIWIDANTQPPEESARRILEFLEKMGLISAAVAA